LRVFIRSNTRNGITQEEKEKKLWLWTVAQCRLLMLQQLLTIVVVMGMDTQ
jgi:hypothetical protein